MEVNAHTHTPRKKWTHYFWEFLMLFLALFRVFLLKGQLEHTLEHQRDAVLPGKKRYHRDKITLNSCTCFLNK